MNTRVCIHWALVCLLVAIAPGWAMATEEAVAYSYDELHREALEDIFVLQDFEARKNSFVMSPTRHVGRWDHEGFRYTLLDVEGTGSIRHIWTTRGGGEPHFDWEFYIDGEASPSIVMTDEEWTVAAEELQVPVAPANTVPLGNRDFNFFLPIPFDESCRIELVQRVPEFWLWFCQIDYRLEDDSMRGARLVSHRDDEGGLYLSYLGLPTQKRTSSVSQLPRSELRIDPVTIAPGESRLLKELSGPSIIRQLRLQWSEQSDLRLQIAYDQAQTHAVDVPIHRFFGPFKGASFFSHGARDASCYLPMPFAKRCAIQVNNVGVSSATVSGKVFVEETPVFAEPWGYFHALHQKTQATTGYRPHQVLYVQGRGHWLGMTLYNTGHDHGGGDFAVIDGEGHDPAFLHGVNGEDYFTFAWFGKGAHHPYAVAHANEAGRYRHHFENVYPFEHSLAVEWGAFAGVSPESVAVWYQDSPENTTLPNGAAERSAVWDVFGPVPIPYDEAGNSVSDPFTVLPSVGALDAGGTFECRGVEEAFVSGWNQQWSVGPMLNLTYIGRHGTAIDPERELGGMGHAMMARRMIDSAQQQTVEYLFCHDDPIELWVNGERIYRRLEPFNGFQPVTISLPFNEGKNEVLVKLTNYFNRNFNWAGFLLRRLETKRP